MSSARRRWFLPGTPSSRTPTSTSIRPFFVSCLPIATSIGCTIPGERSSPTEISPAMPSSGIGCSGLSLADRSPGHADGAISLILRVAHSEQRGAAPVARPFRQAVVHVHGPQPVENVAGGAEGSRYPPRAAEVEQGGEGEPHAAALVGDGSAAAPAGDLAGQCALGPARPAGVEPQAVEAGRQADVPLVEYRRPLHGGTVQHLAVAAMADLCVHRIGAHLVAYGSAVAAGAVTGGEARIPG